MRYAICNETFGDWEHLRVCETIAELGYTGLEIAPFTLAPLITDVSAEQRSRIRQTAESVGITILGLHWLLAKTDGFYLNSPDPGIQKRTGDYFSNLAQAAADLGGDILVLGSPVQRTIQDGVSPSDAVRWALKTIEYCLPTLERTKVKLCLEPLTPKETNFINSAQEAIRLINELQHPQVRLHLDVKAMSAEKASIPDVIQANAEFLEHFHANDTNLRGPGFGNVDFVPILNALKQVNYSGWVSVEVFDYSPDPLTIAKQSIEYLRMCEHKS
jgi:sugar phosphate isomerase/epimerase